MKFETKVKILMQKRYFDAGLGLTNYVKYFIAFFAFASMDVSSTMWAVVIYGIGCYILGFCWFKYGWVKAEIEIENRYNLFVAQMRKKLGVPNKRNI